MVAFNNTKTDKEFDKFSNKIVNKLNILGKLISTVSDITKKNNK